MELEKFREDVLNALLLSAGSGFEVCYNLNKSVVKVYNNRNDASILVYYPYAFKLDIHFAFEFGAFTFDTKKYFEILKEHGYE